MKLIIKYISIIAIVILCIGVIYTYNSFNIDSEINLDNFNEMAKNETTCSDIRNELYLINDNLVFWIVEGSCSDASYSYTLFEDKPETVLCKVFDSIAGPQEFCNNEEYQDLFNILTDNIDNENFGLNNNYKITRFY
jgi:hypothetical protein